MIYMCVEGNANIESNNSICNLRKGETILFPACINHVKTEADSAVLLEVYL